MLFSQSIEAIVKYFQIYLGLIFLITGGLVNAQNSDVDSLKVILENLDEDSSKVNTSMTSLMFYTGPLQVRLLTTVPKQNSLRKRSVSGKDWPKQIRRLDWVIICRVIIQRPLKTGNRL